jgi:hypothetical protein
MAWPSTAPSPLPPPIEKKDRNGENRRTKTLEMKSNWTERN